MEEKEEKKSPSYKAGYKAGEIFAWVVMICFAAIVVTGTAAVCYRVWNWIL